MSRSISALFTVFTLFAQTTGSVKVTAPTPEKVVATAGSVVCTLTGNALPATAVTVACTIGTVVITPYTIPLPAGSSYVFDQRLSGDDITFTLQAAATGGIAWQAAATPNGGTAATGSGTF